MRTLIISSLFLFTSSAFAAYEGWQVIAESGDDCPVTIQVMAKEGENYVRVLHEGKDKKLTSQSKTAYSDKARKGMVFESSKEEARVEKVKFTSKGTEDSTDPKIVIEKSGKTQACNLKVK